MEKPSPREDALLAAQAAALVLLAHLLFMLLSGKYPLADNPYNSYVRQACAWLQGRLSLPENCPWLELAVLSPQPYHLEFYVSFPPLPSYLLLPLAALFGENAPDGLLALLSLLVGLWYAVRLAGHFRLSRFSRVMLPVLLCCGSNLWQVTVDAWVWFLAQNLGFTFTMASFWYACQGKKGKSAFCLAAAVGCRPFQVIYTPLMCLLLAESRAEFSGNRRGKVLKWLFWDKDYRYIPAAVLGGSYMALNWARFGSPWEFGHSYLPEFTRSEWGQFSFAYLGENLPTLFRLPELDGETGRVVFPMYNGSNIFLVNPILVLWAVVLLVGIFRGVRGRKMGIEAAIMGMVACHVVALCCHKTMGGNHFGNRYIVDILPGVYIGVCEVAGEERWWRMGVELGLVWGLLLNFWGTLSMYQG